MTLRKGCLDEQCMWCGNTWNLHNHHIIYLSHTGPKWDYGNRITLCAVHHHQVHEEPWKLSIERVLSGLRGSEHWRWDHVWDIIQPDGVLIQRW